MSDKLVAFYSRADENYVSGMIKTLAIGNTEIAAGFIAKLTGADTFKIEQAQPYSKNYNECIAQAQADQNRNARPELKAYPETMEQYSEIYLGFPNYWGTMPMAVFTFLEHFDFSGKTIKRRRRAKGKYLFKAPLTLISASLIPTKSIDIGATASPKEETKSTTIRGRKSDRENIKIIIPIYVGIVDGLKKIFFKEIKTLFPVYMNRPADQEKKENPIT